ncbi:polyprotein [Spatholobus suberectus]|nr:polyprotein [Spatholobus suberectus]
MVIANFEDQIPSIIQVPKRIPRKELEELIPFEWISNYELFKKAQTPVIASDSTFKRLSNGNVKTIFNKKEDRPSSSNGPVFSTMMISLGEKEEEIPIYPFRQNGTPIYSDKLNGHFLWDVALEECDPDCDCWRDRWDSSDTEDEPKQKRRGPCKPLPKPRRPEPKARSWVAFKQAPKPLPLYNEMIKILRKEKIPPLEDPNLITWPPPSGCREEENKFSFQEPFSKIGEWMMFSQSSSTEKEDFPTLERKWYEFRSRVSIQSTVRENGVSLLFRYPPLWVRAASIRVASRGRLVRAVAAFAVCWRCCVDGCSTSSGALQLVGVLVAAEGLGAAELAVAEVALEGAGGGGWWPEIYQSLCRQGSSRLGAVRLNIATDWGKELS